MVPIYQYWLLIPGYLHQYRYGIRMRSRIRIGIPIDILGSISMNKWIISRINVLLCIWAFNCFQWNTSPSSVCILCFWCQLLTIAFWIRKLRKILQNKRAPYRSFRGPQSPGNYVYLGIGWWPWSTYPIGHSVRCRIAHMGAIPSLRQTCADHP